MLERIAKNKLKFIASSFVFLMAIFFVFGNISYAQETLDKDIMFGGDDTGGAAGVNEQLGGLTERDPRIIIARIINILFGFLGIVAVSLVMYGGWLWMSSNGEEQKITRAKQVLKNAAIGLAIILASFAIVSFVIDMPFKAGDTGMGGGASGGIGGGGVGALGNGILESVYPAPGATNIPRNTAIIVKFREPMNLASICEDTNGNGLYCDGEDIVMQDSVKIFQYDAPDACLVDGNCIQATGFSQDGASIIMTPVDYLGSPDGDVTHDVLLTSEILKTDGTQAFPGFSTGYEWVFEVSNSVDLDPPYVVDVGIFPGTDDLPDVITESDPVWAQGSITVIDNNVIKSGATATIGDVTANPGSPEASAGGSYSCLEDGTVNISVVGPAPLTFSVGGVDGLESSVLIDGSGANIGCGIVFSLNDVANDEFSPGNSWSFDVTAGQQATTLTIGGFLYKFVDDSMSVFEIVKGGNEAETASNISNAINNSGNTKVDSSVSGATITLDAIVGGANGNSIVVSSNMPSAFEIVPMSGGADSGANSIIMSTSDKYRNTIIQINFNEAILPLTVTGPSSDVANTIKVQADGVDLEGEFFISNQYKTIEFITNNECGVNGCGEKIYCLPGDSKITVSVKSARLITCSNDGSCANNAPYNKCVDIGSASVCQNTLKNENYPRVNYLDLLSTGGVVDSANNSFDGNGNKNADGPIEQNNRPSFNMNDLISTCSDSAVAPGYSGLRCTYFDAASTCGAPNACFYIYNDSTTAVKDPAVHLAEVQDSTSDDFTWSFHTNNEIKKDPPLIELTKPAGGEIGFSLISPIEVLFDVVMSSTSLGAGSTVINNGLEPVVHQLINLWDLASRPVGYWVTKENSDENNDGEADKTNVFIGHTEFSGSSSFKTQIGSGVRDIYQNCYKPSSSAGCSGIPSCCNGTPTADSVCP